jgi:hypothetical protein
MKKRKSDGEDKVHVGADRRPDLQAAAAERCMSAKVVDSGR